MSDDFESIQFQDCQLTKVKQFHNSLYEIKQKLPVKLKLEYDNLILNMKYYNKLLLVNKSCLFDYIVKNNDNILNQLFDDLNINNKNEYNIDKNLKNNINALELKINDINNDKANIENLCEKLYKTYDEICYFLKTISIK